MFCKYLTRQTWQQLTASSVIATTCWTSSSNLNWKERWFKWLWWWEYFKSAAVIGFYNSQRAIALLIPVSVLLMPEGRRVESERRRPGQQKVVPGCRISSQQHTSILPEDNMSRRLTSTSFLEHDSDFECFSLVTHHSWNSFSWVHSLLC